VLAHIEIAMTPLHAARFTPVSSRAVLAMACIALAATALLGFERTLSLSSSASSAAATTRPATQVRPLSCEPLADVPGKSVTTARVHFPPGAYTPAHRHPGSVTAYVISGSIRSQIDGTPAQTYSTGSTWFEPAGALHLFAENASLSDTAELLAVFVTDHDCGPLVIPDAPAGTRQADAPGA
jgi:quercetin dioxygenase-like cupin family protein